MTVRLSPLVALVLALLLACTAAGCDEDGPGDGSTTPTTTTGPATTTAPDGGEPTAAEAEVRVYLVRGEHVGAVARAVTGPAVLRRALEELMAGPTPGAEEAGLSTAVPDGVDVLDVSLADGTATIDVSGAFAEGGGSLSMFLRLAQLVHTATQFPSVERVALRIDGEPVTTFSAEGIELPETLTRADVEEQAPAILVESPLPGARVPAPLRVRGTANTFEANVEWELVTASGAVVASGFTTAACGTGCRGAFAFEKSFDAAGAATLRLFERSAADGSETKVVEIPLVLAAGS